MERIEAGQLVQLREENSIPAKWTVARILKVYPGDDDNVRVLGLEKHTASMKPHTPKDFSKYMAICQAQNSQIRKSEPASLKFQKLICCVLKVI